MYSERVIDPPDKPMPECPICGEGAEEIYMDWQGNVFGCNKCIITEDAQEWEEEHKLV